MAGGLLWTGGTPALFFASTPVQSNTLEAGSVTLGALEKVRLALYGTPGSDVTVQIRTISAGLPSGAILASTTIPAAAIPAGTPYAYTVR